MKKILLLSLVMLLAGCEINKLTDEQIKVVANSCKDGSVKIINNLNESSAYCQKD